MSHFNNNPFTSVGTGVPSPRPPLESKALLHPHLAHITSFTDSPLVFLTATIRNRRPVLNTTNAHKILRGIWERSAPHDGWYVGDYLLMPDHIYLFARPARDAKPMGHWVKMWKALSSREMNQTSDCKGPIWQADYFDRYLRNDESYSEKWAYVELNPVRARLVEDASHWPHKGRIHELRM